jgi:hypothetical protein
MGWSPYLTCEYFYGVGDIPSKDSPQMLPSENLFQPISFRIYTASNLQITLRTYL